MISESCIEKKKLSQIFIFTILCGASKDFMKVFKAFMKAFEARQKKCENKNLILSLRPRLGQEVLMIHKNKCLFDTQAFYVLSD